MFLENKNSAENERIRISMNSESSISEAKFAYSHHLVAFMDLLGQREKLLRIEGIIKGHQSESEEKRLFDTLRGTAGTIRQFRHSFSDFFRM